MHKKSSALLSPAIAIALAGLSLAMAPSAARADDTERFSIIEENDSILFNSDRHYTQGIRFSYLGPSLAPDSGWNGTYNLFGSFTPAFVSAPNSTRKFAIFAGQNLFTPQNLQLKPPDSTDRPYAGWLYGGASLLQETPLSQSSSRALLENLELDFGVVGPGALGKLAQNNFHGLIGTAKARGWSNQVQHEIGGMLSYERFYRLPLIGEFNGIDFVPQGGVTLGNVMTYGDVGGMLRIGKNLGADFGPARIRPALSGTDYFNADRLDGKLGFYVFVGAQGRAVGQNIFLDGNTFRTSPHVSKKILVADLQAGVSLFWSSSLRIDITALRRTPEFEGQHAPDKTASFALAFSW
jgi:lipid A 3-O-deacylase